MKSAQTIVYLAIVLALSGCRKVIRPTDTYYAHTPDELAELQMKCDELENEPSIMDLLQQIKMAHKEMLYYIGLPDPLREVQRIEAISAEIQATGEKITSYVDPAWTDARWSQVSTWEIYLSRNTKIYEAAVESIFYLGRKNDFLKEKILVSHEGNKIVITLNNEASTLELCEFQKSLFIIIEAKYQRRSWNKKQFFTLSPQGFERKI